MAGEIILVVDDEPVSLRLTAAVLRRDGYRVQVASNGEQAVSMLRTLRPDLILSDVRLPGIDGLELARMVRGDPRTAAVPVVAITAASDPEDELLAYQAGCDGFIRKPIDTQTIGARLRVFLGNELQPAAAPQVPAPAAASSIPEPLALEGPQMDALRRMFLRDAIREVRRMLEFLGSGFDKAMAARLFHQWIGSAGALGYSAAAVKSREAEELLASGATPAQMGRVLNELAALLSAPREAAEIHVPEAILERLSHRRIALLGFEGEEADRTCATLGQAGAAPYLLPADEPADSSMIRSCAAVIVRVGDATRSSPWLAGNFTPPPGVPCLFAGTKEDIFALPARVQANAAEFLLDAWQAEEIVMRLSRVLALAQDASETTAAAPERRPVPARPEILVVDDDANVLAVVRTALESRNMRVRCASNGPEALRLVGETAPDALVLDVNMSGMDGFEVLAAIRRQALPARVVMLTARQQERDILRGFELGADDYVVKPFSPLELVARLERLL